MKSVENHPGVNAIVEPLKTFNLGAISVPPEALFSDSQLYWEMRQNAAEVDSNIYLADIARTTARSFGVLAANRDLAEHCLMQQQDMSAGQQTALLTWYNAGVSLMGISYLLMELPGIENLELGGIAPASLGAHFDFQPEHDPHRSGVHVRNTEISNPPAPGTVVWQEGDAIMLRTVTPATPTTALSSIFFNLYDGLLPVHEFTTFVPRLKREVWEQ